MRNNKVKLQQPLLQWEAGRSSWRPGHINVFFLPNTLSFGVEHEIKCRLSEDYILIAFQAVSFRQQRADRTARTSPPQKTQKKERELSSQDWPECVCSTSAAYCMITVKIFWTRQPETYKRTTNWN